MYVLELKRKYIIGIDLAGLPKNPSGWALLEGNKVETCLVYRDSEILEGIMRSRPAVTAIDAPFNLPKRGLLRKADREMIKRGFRIFPPTLAAMRILTLRATILNKLIEEKGYKTIEVHPTSTRKALSMPSKEWEKIQETLLNMGLKGTLQTRNLTPHEIDAVTSALTAYLHTQNQTEAIGDEEGGYIIIPKKQNWRTIQI